MGVAHTYVCTNTYINTYICMYAWSNSCTNMNTHTTHTHTHVCSYVLIGVKTIRKIGVAVKLLQGAHTVVWLVLNNYRHDNVCMETHGIW